MKFILKYVCVCLLFGACASVPTSKQNKSFIVLHTKDTIFGKKIRFARGIGKIGNVKVVNANGETQIFQYDEVYQIYHYRKNRDFYMEEMVMLTLNNSISYTPMDVISSEGSIKLYEHDPTNWGNTTFVVSDVFYGYIRTKKDFEKFVNALTSCNFFKEKLNTEKLLFSDETIQEIIRFYNQNCE